MPRSGYDQIAEEYYDPRHRTSRNFDNATAAALTSLPFTVPTGLVLEVGAGRGRTQEFLGLPPERIVQLDNSEAMFSLQPREKCLMKVLADACAIPLVSEQFAAVTGFLVDPFLGLSFLFEAYRMLVPGGKLLLTTPSERWGIPLRRKIQIDDMTTRFKVIGTERIVTLPSLLHSKEQLIAMLSHVGFHEIVICDHYLPPSETPISPDITSVSESLEIDVFELPVIQSIRAMR